MEDYNYSSADYNLEGSSWEEPKDAIKLSKFDLRLRRKWDEAMEAGHFRYSLDHTRSRIISGPERFIAELNLKRGIQRRVPEKINTVNMPFDPAKFNFTKVKNEEILFRLRPIEDSEESSAMNGMTNGCEAATEKTNGNSQTNNDENGHKNDDRHLLLINVSPLAYGHGLVVCNADDNIPQTMSLISHKMAIETLLLSNHPGFRAGFNSLCALASVNHQHFHVWYMDEPLTIETAPTKSICPGVYEMIGKPTRALVLQLHGHTVDEVAKMAFTISNFYQNNNIAHNVFLTRGSAIGDQNGVRTVRIYIWPRKSVIVNKPHQVVPGIKSESGGTLFNVAVAELAGFVPMYSAEEFDDVTEQDIIEIIQNHLLPDDQFDSLRDQIIQILQKEQQ